MTVTPISDGPNAGYWYVADISVSLAMHAQVLHDVRPDGYQYAFTSSSDPGMTTSCGTAGTASPSRMYDANVTCKSNASFSDFYNRTWQHENCHMTVAIAKFDSIPDAKTLGERVVGTDSISAVVGVQGEPWGLMMASDSVRVATKALDTLPSTSYSLWFCQPSSSSWSLTTVNAFNGLVPGC